MSEDTISIPIEVKPLDMDGPGFLPRYREILRIQRMFARMQEADPTDVDKAMEFLADFITKPESHAEKLDALNKVTFEELMNLMNAIAGRNIVTPTKGGG